MILLDTDHLSIVLDARGMYHDELVERLRTCGDTLAIPIISIEEQFKGWLAQINRTRDVEQQIPAYERLQRLIEFFRKWQIQRFDSQAAAMFKSSRKQKIRIGTQDLKIASIAVTQNALLLSANLGDFRQVPGLRVENWLER